MNGLSITIPTRGTIPVPWPASQMDGLPSAEVNEWVNGQLGGLSAAELAVMAEALEGAAMGLGLGRRRPVVSPRTKAVSRSPSLVRQLRRAAVERRKLETLRRDMEAARAVPAQPPVEHPAPPPVSPVNIYLPGTTQPAASQAVPPPPPTGYPGLPEAGPLAPAAAASLPVPAVTPPALPPPSEDLSPLAPPSDPLAVTSPLPAPSAQPPAQPAGYRPYFQPLTDADFFGDEEEDWDNDEDYPGQFFGLLSDAGRTPVSVSLTAAPPPATGMPVAIKAAGAALLGLGAWLAYKEFRKV